MKRREERLARGLKLQTAKRGSKTLRARNELEVGELHFQRYGPAGYRGAFDPVTGVAAIRVSSDASVGIALVLVERPSAMTDLYGRSD